MNLKIVINIPFAVIAIGYNFFLSLNNAFSTQLFEIIFFNKCSVTCAILDVYTFSLSARLYCIPFNVETDFKKKIKIHHFFAR